MMYIHVYSVSVSLVRKKASKQALFSSPHFSGRWLRAGERAARAPGGGQKSSLALHPWCTEDATLLGPSPCSGLSPLSLLLVEA